jgi:hypothetical protein
LHPSRIRIIEFAIWHCCCCQPDSSSTHPALLLVFDCLKAAGSTTRTAKMWVNLFEVWYILH